MHEQISSDSAFFFMFLLATAYNNDRVLKYQKQCVCVMFPSSRWYEVQIRTVVHRTSPSMAAWRLLTKGLLLMVPKLQASVYDILPSTTAVFSYASGSRKLSANEQIFVGAQTVVSLLQTTQIISGVCFITDHVAYTSSNKTKIVWIETELFFFLLWVDAPHVYVHAWVLDCFHSFSSTRTFWRALTTSVDSCAEIKSAPSVA